MQSNMFGKKGVYKIKIKVLKNIYDNKLSKIYLATLQDWCDEMIMWI